MTVSAFLAKLANDLERGPRNVSELKRWAMLCRDYAVISSFFDEDGDMKIIYLQPVPWRKREGKRAVATIPMDAAERTSDCD